MSVFKHYSSHRIGSADDEEDYPVQTLEFSDDDVDAGFQDGSAFLSSGTDLDNSMECLETEQYNRRLSSNVVRSPRKGRVTRSTRYVYNESFVMMKSGLAQTCVPNS